MTTKRVERIQCGVHSIRAGETLGASCLRRIQSSRESEAGSRAVGSIGMGQGESCQHVSEVRGREGTRPVEEFRLGGGK